MKTDRLLEIIIYLLNHETVTARHLAGRFGVSVRTIQRDMDDISLAGIPLVSVVGNQGGYYIDPRYKIGNQYITAADIALIVTALKSLSSAYEDGRLDSILGRYQSLKAEGTTGISLDYGVTRENADVMANNKLIEEAISRSVEIRFYYRDAEGATTRKTVRPLILRFKWYAWYLFAFDPERDDFRTYKVARMTRMDITGSHFQRYRDAEKLLAASEARYLRTCESIEVWCRGDCIATLGEYFPGEKTERLDDGNYILHLHVPPGERLWQALLLSMGDQVKILSPAHYRERLIRTAIDFLSNYDIHVS